MLSCNDVWWEDKSGRKKKIHKSLRGAEHEVSCFSSPHIVLAWEISKERLTGTDNLLDLDEGNINFLCEFSHRLVWVLVGERVDINLDP